MFIHKQRMEPRSVIAVDAVMRWADEAPAARLVNASSRGVLAIVEAPPPRGTPVDLIIAGHVLKGQVRWRGADRCGIAIRSTVSVLDLIEGKAVPVIEVPGRMARLRPMDLLRSMLG